jgi:hypothetical protein
MPVVCGHSAALLNYRTCASSDGSAPRSRNVFSDETARQEFERIQRETASATTAAAATASAASSTASSRINVADDGSHQPGAHVGDQGKYDPWAVLGLKPGASAHDIRLRYNDLSKEFHPTIAPAGTANIDKWTEIDRAYQLVTNAPTLDSRFRSLISETQHWYYRFLPEWMARNVDDTPRWFAWLRWRLPPRIFVVYMLVASYVAGRLISIYPLAGPALVCAIMWDFLFHSSVAPFLLLFFIFRVWSTSGTDISWLMSPKSFLQRELTY